MRICLNSILHPNISYIRIINFILVLLKPQLICLGVHIDSTNPTFLNFKIYPIHNYFNTCLRFWLIYMHLSFLCVFLVLILSLIKFVAVVTPTTNICMSYIRKIYNLIFFQQAQLETFAIINQS